MASFVKKMAAEAIGAADISDILNPSEFAAASSSAFVMHESGEKVYAILRSRKDEYTFTNLALIHLDGTSAMSKKRLIKRYPFRKYFLSEVLFETAGTIDLDCELKFKLGDQYFSIDVAKAQTSSLAVIYKALVAISERQEAATIARSFGDLAITRAEAVVEKNYLSSHANPVPSTILQQIVEFEHAYRVRNFHENTPVDFSDVWHTFTGL